MNELEKDRLHVMVVDDDASMVRLIGSALNRKFSDSLRVTTTTEPAYVWSTAAAGDVDICLTDMKMPSINGFKLLKQLKQINPLTQVIFLTAHPTFEAARSAFTMGVDDFLAKPVNLDDLCNCVHFIMQRKLRLNRDLIETNLV